MILQLQLHNIPNQIDYFNSDTNIIIVCYVNLTCGSGRSGKSTASRAYTPSFDLKSGIPQDTETPAPVNTIIRFEVPKK